MMQRPRPAPGVPEPEPIYRFAAWVGIIVMRLQRWRFSVHGIEHVPATGGCLIAANHTSFWDFFAVGRPAYETYGRPVRILAKKSLFDVPIFGRLMYRTGCIPVDRGNGAGALRHAIDALGAGELVLILPEGTLSRSFDLLTFRSGAARMAAAAGVPLVPAVTWGTQRFYTSGRRPRWAWRLPIEVHYGAALQPTPDDPSDLVTAKLRAEMAGLLDAAITDYEDGTPPGEWWVPHRFGGGAPDHATVETEYRRTRALWRRRRRKPK